MDETANIKARRIALGLTQTELADLSACGQSSVSRLELGGSAARAIRAAVLNALTREERKRARLS